MAPQTFSPDSYLQQKGVAIAIGSGRYQFEAVAGGLALRPQLVAGTAEKSNVAGPERLLERFPIHEAEHQNLVAVGVLHDGGQQPLHLVEIKLFAHGFSRFVFKNKKPAVANRAVTSRM